MILVTEVLGQNCLRQRKKMTDTHQKRMQVRAFDFLEDRLVTMGEPVPEHSCLGLVIAVAGIWYC